MDAREERGLVIQQQARLKRTNWVGKFLPSPVMVVTSSTLTTARPSALALTLRSDSNHANIFTLWNLL